MLDHSKGPELFNSQRYENIKPDVGLLRIFLKDKIMRNHHYDFSFKLNKVLLCITGYLIANSIQFIHYKSIEVGVFFSIEVHISHDSSCDLYCDVY